MTIVRFEDRGRLYTRRDAEFAGAHARHAVAAVAAVAAASACGRARLLGAMVASPLPGGHANAEGRTPSTLMSKFDTVAGPLAWSKIDATVTCFAGMGDAVRGVTVGVKAWSHAPVTAHAALRGARRPGRCSFSAHSPPDRIELAVARQHCRADLREPVLAS
jgi:hypothetical protein